MFRSTLVAAALLVAPSARAQEVAPVHGCPLALPVHHVSSTMTTVTIDDRTFAVRGPAYRFRFHRMLLSCGMVESAATFAGWRALRRATNFTGVVGFFTTPVWFATVGTGAAAGALRWELEQRIREEGSRG